jgi:hypothetical protein
MGLDDFAVSQVFSASFAMTEGDFRNYLASHARKNLI